MRHHLFTRSWLLLLFCALLAFACAPPAEEGEEAAPEEAAAEEEAPEPAEPAGPAGPEPTAEAVWAHLESESYQESWDLWPGKGELYEGTEPHGALLTTYVNAAASDAVGAGQYPLPDGSIVVKENYMPDETLAAVTVMYKSAGYDPGFNDWFWLKRLADGTVEASGQVEMCQSCHAQAAEFDYLVTAFKASEGGEEEEGGGEV